VKKEDYLPTCFSWRRCILLISLTLGIYLLENPPILSLTGTSNFHYIIKPLLWAGVCALVLFMPAVRPKAKLNKRSLIFLWSFNSAVIFIVIQVLGGVMDSFGRSPYDHSLSGSAVNLIYLAAVLTGRELVRNYLVNSARHKESYVIFVSIALLMSLTLFPLEQYTSIKNTQEFIKFLAQHLGPEFSKNLLATYLAYLGGPLASLIFIGGSEAFTWFSPLLPNLRWITSALIGILTPIFLFMIIQSIYKSESKSRAVRSLRGEEGPAGWIFTTLFSILVIWFSVGVFPIYPSVVVTGSMKPMIKPGDVILVSKSITLEDLKKGDVIQFKRDTILISHRIVSVIDKNGQISYRTKGDNNNTEDLQLVQPEDVRGKIIKVIPKIGWPTMLLKSSRDIPPNEVEF